MPRNEWDRLAGLWPDEPPRVSVIVAHYEQQAELDRTLLALTRQDHPADRLEIIVVDDGSATPPTVPAGVRLVRQDDRGFRLAAARNAGAAIATGQVLCFIDADTVPEPGYVAHLTRLPALAPDVVAVGRRRHAELSGLDPAARVESAAPASELPEPRWLREAYERTHDLLQADDRSYRYVIGAVIACDAGFFRETAGFDESFTEYGGEDWEWTYRAWLCGAVLAHVSEAVAWHDGPEWAERPDGARGDASEDAAEHAAQDRKNAEVLRLAGLVPLPGSGPRGLRGDHADIRVALPDGIDPASPAWFATRDSIAADLPLAALPGDSRGLGRCRIRIDVARPLQVSDGGLRLAVERVTARSLAALTVVDAEGETLCVIRSLRAEVRARRWSRGDLFENATGEMDGIDAILPGFHLEAYLGGWG